MDRFRDLGSGRARCGERDQKKKGICCPSPDLEVQNCNSCDPRKGIIRNRIIFRGHLIVTQESRVTRSDMCVTMRYMNPFPKRLTIFSNVSNFLYWSTQEYPSRN